MRARVHVHYHSYIAQPMCGTKYPHVTGVNDCVRKCKSSAKLLKLIELLVGED